MKFFTILYFFCSPLFAAGPVEVDAGNSVNNGGDAVAIEFTATAREVAAELNSSRKNKRFGDQVKLFQQSVFTTQVNTTDEPLILDGKIVDAINNSENHTIVVNRPRWLEDKRITSRSKREALVIHEYLEAIGVKDFHYEISNQLVKRLNSNTNIPTF